jgi:hypothetical protein
MLYNLISEHWPLVSKVRQEWIDHFLKLEFDEDKARSLILYLLSEACPHKEGSRLAKNCQLLFVDDPRKIQRIINRYTWQNRFPVLTNIWEHWNFDLREKAKSQLISHLTDRLLSNHSTNIVQQVYDFINTYFLENHLREESSDYESAIRLLTVRKLLLEVREQIAGRIPAYIVDWIPFFPQGNSLVFLLVKQAILGGMRRDYVLPMYQDRILHFAPHGDFSDFEWVSLYDALQKCGVVSINGLSEYIELLRANVFLWIVRYGLVVACRPPQYVKFDDRNRLHCVDDYAVKFRGGYGQFWIHGTNFDAKSFKKFFIKKRFSPVDVLGFPNVEQRITLIRHFGFEVLFDNIDRKRFIDRDKCVSAVTGKPVTCELYDCALDGLRPMRLLKLEDHTTHKPVVLSIPISPETSTCKGAIAWTFGIEESDYTPIFES